MPLHMGANTAIISFLASIPASRLNALLNYLWLRRNTTHVDDAILERHASVHDDVIHDGGTRAFSQTTRLYFPSYGWENTGQPGHRVPIGSIIKGLGLYAGTKSAFGDGSTLIHVYCPAHRVIKNSDGILDAETMEYGLAHIECRVDSTLVQAYAFSQGPYPTFIPFDHAH
ncbi:hypothetical protein AURDEDRAFT_131428 [Auricularia subglabra TFB-10046 SS5]|uniref:Uncharacterized protein n=1 Tax=Auricularia subglabra (strain TFB-10046 / SS5) TaxID=717982 RepID=J0WQ08_AURST|nr:hypothetical protein AURDEDRAFT_131428 [Auricularia subglabra TFB-10046 SS5]